MAHRAVHQSQVAVGVTHPQAPIMEVMVVLVVQEHKAQSTAIITLVVAVVHHMTPLLVLEAKAEAVVLALVLVLLDLAVLEDVTMADLVL